jgi:hypothetical protein
VSASLPKSWQVQNVKGGCGPTYTFCTYMFWTYSPTPTWSKHLRWHNIRCTWRRSIKTSRCRRMEWTCLLSDSLFSRHWLDIQYDHRTNETSHAGYLYRPPCVVTMTALLSSYIRVGLPCTYPWLFLTLWGIWSHMSRNTVLDLTIHGPITFLR